MYNGYDHEPRLRPTKFRKRFYISWAIGLAGSLVAAIPHARNHIPEPFDIFNHVANLNTSAPMGYAVGYLAGLLYSGREQQGTEEHVRRKTRGIMALGGLVAGVAVNTVSETKLGMSITHVGTTGDIIDFAYGTIAATALGALLPKIETE